MTVTDMPSREREHAELAEQVADLSATLVELDDHPGLQHVRRYAPTGVTARRWTVVDALLGKLWDDLSCARAHLDSGPTIPVTRDVAVRLDRISRGLPAVVEFLDDVDEVNTRVIGGVAPLLKRLDDRRVAPPDELTALLAVSATDPLSLTLGEVDTRIADLADVIVLSEDWPRSVEETAGRLDEMRDVRERATAVRARAERAVLTGSLPLPVDHEPDLRAELRSLTPADAVALRSLRRRIDAALLELRRDGELAQGLLDRRDELNGRLRAYEAKAARLGVAEDPELLSSGRIAAGLLSRRPCDLAAVTRAVADYQALLTEMRGRQR
jgi:hypothetical protein